MPNIVATLKRVLTVSFFVFVAAGGLWADETDDYVQSRCNDNTFRACRWPSSRKEKSSWPKGMVCPMSNTTFLAKPETIYQSGSLGNSLRQRR